VYKRTKKNINLKSFGDLLKWFSLNFCLLCHLYHITYSGHAAGGAVGWGYKPEGCGFDSRWCHWNFSL